MPLIAPIPHIYNRWPLLVLALGATDQVDFGSDVKIDDLGTNALFTVAFWIYVTTQPSGGEAFLQKRLGGTNGWRLWPQATAGTLSGSQVTSGTDTIYITSTLPLDTTLLNRWMLIGYVHDGAAGAGAKHKIYHSVGDVLVADTMTVTSEGTGTGGTDAAQNMILGAGVLGSYGPFAFWNQKLLSAADLQEWLLNPLRPVQAPTILAYPDPMGPGYTDYSGNGLHGVRTGGQYTIAPRYLARNHGKRFWAVSVAVAGGTTFNQSVAGVLSFNGGLVKQANKVLAGVLSFNGALAKSTSKFFTGVLSFNGTLVKQTSKFFTGVLTFSGALTASKVILQAVVGVLSFVGSLTTNLIVGGTIKGTSLLWDIIRRRKKM